MIDFSKHKNIVEDYKKIKKMVDKAFTLQNKRHATQKDYDKADEILKEQKNFKHTIFARDVFDVLVKENPKLLERKTKKVFRFKEIYGEDFDKISDEDILATLAMYSYMRDYTYMLQEKCITVDGELLDVEEYTPCKLGYETGIWRNGQIVEDSFRFGVPTYKFFKLSLESKEEHRVFWKGLSDKEKENWMKKELWKEFLKKHNIE